MTIKFITLNAWHGGTLMAPMLDFLEAQNPDVLVLQEAYNDPRPELEARFRTLESIQTRLHYAASDFAGSFRQIFPNNEIVQGNAVMSRLPIIGRKVTFFDRPFDEHYVDEPQNFPTISRNLQHVTLETLGGELNIFNFQGVWDLDGDNDSPQRQNMVDVILKAIEGKPNVILAGDTNAKPTNPAMRRLEPQLKSVFGTTLTTSFNMRQKTNPGYATATVDMIYVSPNIEVLARECPNVDVSDHLPLVTMLKY